MARNTDSLKAIRAEIASLYERRDALTSQLEIASRDTDDAQRERRRLLIEVDDSEARSRAKVEAAYLTAETRKRSLDDALRALVQRIHDAEQHLAGDEARLERERRAAHIEASATTIDAAAERLGRALAEAAAALDDIEGAIPAELHLRTEEGITNGVNPQFRPILNADVCSALLIEALHHVRPTAFHAEPVATPFGPMGFRSIPQARMRIDERGVLFDRAWDHTGFAETHDAVEAARMFLSEKVRLLATEVRAEPCEIAEAEAEAA